MASPGPITTFENFREDGGHLGNLLPGFGGVIAIIEPDANQLGRTGDGREKPDRIQWKSGIGRRVADEVLDAWRGPQRRWRALRAYRRSPPPEGHYVTTSSPTHDARFGAGVRALKGNELHRECSFGNSYAAAGF